jgi:hypothetical protein
MNKNEYYHEENNKKAKMQVMNTLKEAGQRKKMLLNPMQPRLNGHQKGVVMFYMNPQRNCDCESNARGGSNITYSARLPGDEYEKYRKQLLQRRTESLEAMKEEGGPPPMVELSQNEGEQLQGDLLLDTITAQITEGDLNDVLSPIFRYIQYLVKNVYFFTENKFVELINIFYNLETVVRTRFEAFRIREQYLNKSKFKKLIYGKESAFLIENIVKYLKLNMKGLGLDQKQRVILAKSTIYALKIASFEKTMRSRKESKDYLDQMIDDATPPASTMASLGITSPPAPPPTEYTPPDPATTLFP